MRIRPHALYGQNIYSNDIQYIIKEEMKHRNRVVKTCKLLLILTRQRRPLGVRLPNTLKFKGLILPRDDVCTDNHVYSPSVLEQRPTHPYLLT